MLFTVPDFICCYNVCSRIVTTDQAGMCRQILYYMLLLKYQLRKVRHYRGFIYKIHDLLTRSGHSIVHLGVSRS